MGASNIESIFSTGWATAGLSQNAFIIFLRMAHLSLDQKDTRPARVYFAGHALLADAMGKPLPDEPDSEEHGEEATADRKLRNTRLRQVRKYITELRKAGAITDLESGHRGSRANYKLHPEYHNRPVDNVARNVHISASTVDAEIESDEKAGALSPSPVGALSTYGQVLSAPVSRCSQHLPRNTEEQRGTLRGTPAALQSQPQKRETETVDNSTDAA